MFDTIMEVLTVISTIFIPIAGGIITYIQLADAIKANRMRNFRFAAEVSPEDRGEYADSAKEIYRKLYADKIEKNEIVVRNLVYPKQWVQAKDNHDFMHLNDVAVTITDKEWRKRPPKTKSLPYPKDGYSLNKKYNTFSSNVLLFNGRLFALDDAKGDINHKTLAISVKNGGYFDLMDTCEFLIYEMSFARKIKHKRLPFKVTRNPMLSDLPVRSMQLDIFDLENRFAGIGINNVTIMYNVDCPGDVGREKKTLLLMHRRSGGVAEGIGSLHVIPAGSYQPVGSGIHTEFNKNMANTIYREFGEELFNIDELFHLSEETMLEDKYRKWPVLLLGMGIEPLNNKIEVLTAIQIDMSKQENVELFGGSDSVEKLRRFFQTNYEGDLITVQFDKKILSQYTKDPRTTPAAKEILTILDEHFDFFKTI